MFQNLKAAYNVESFICLVGKILNRSRFYLKPLGPCHLYGYGVELQAFCFRTNIFNGLQEVSVTTADLQKCTAWLNDGANFLVFPTIDEIIVRQFLVQVLVESIVSEYGLRKKKTVSSVEAFM